MHALDIGIGQDNILYFAHEFRRGGLPKQGGNGFLYRFAARNEYERRHCDAAPAVGVEAAEAVYEHG